MQAEHKTTADPSELPEHARRMARRRSLNTALIFTRCDVVRNRSAVGSALALVCCALFSYLVPELHRLRHRPQTPDLNGAMRVHPRGRHVPHVNNLFK